MCAPYMWYQNDKHFPLWAVVPGTIELISFAVSFSFLGEDDSMYMYHPFAYSVQQNVVRALKLIKHCYTVLLSWSFFTLIRCCRFFKLKAWTTPGVVNRWRSVSICKSIKIGKSDLIDIDFIDQSVEIDDTLGSFIDLSRFYRFHRFLSEDTSFCSSVHPKIENWFHANSEFVDNWVAIESRRIKQFNITFLKKSFFKKPHLFFKTRFKVFFGWPTLARFFLFFPVFHDLDLPPFQNNLRSPCRYFPEKPIDKNWNR